MAAPAKKLATYFDLEAVPPHLVAEIINGSLETHSCSIQHSHALTQLIYHLIGPFERGRDGPGGWNFLPKTELHIGGDLLVPDLAGWRRERLPSLPDAAFMELAPDWVGEIVSPATTRLNRGAKRTIYAEIGVAFLWVIDPQERVLEAFLLTRGNWRLESVAVASEFVKLPPFDAATFSLDILFEFDPPSRAPTPQG